MHWDVVLRVLGVFLVIFSTAMLPPMAISLTVDDGAARPFLTAYFISLATGLLLWLPLRRGNTRDPRLRDGFMIVVLFWTVLAAFGALPLLLTPAPEMNLAEAFFESMSGLTTTGATVLTGIDHLPLSVRYYRQQLQWLGGMGIIVLAVAIMPVLGVGGMQLYRAEMPGPVKESKMTPRMAETAKALWYIYVGLTVLCALCYWVAGMGPLDAVGHAFSTLAIGGFSTHDASLGHFDSPAVDAVAVVFMAVAGINFALHFTVWRTGNPLCYVRDPEVRLYLGVLVTVSLLSAAVLASHGAFADPLEAVRQGIFQSVSVATTTGYTTGGFNWWPSFLPAMLILASFIGGCAHSTAGGLKVIRVLLLVKQGMREITRLIHPNAIIPLKLGTKAVPDRVVSAVWGFFSLYVASFVVLALAVSATGTDFVTAFSAVAACMNNLGPGLGEVAENYAVISDTAKWLLTVAMLLGRLELFTLLVILTPTFWRD